MCFVYIVVVELREQVILDSHNRPNPYPRRHQNKLPSQSYLAECHAIKIGSFKATGVIGSYAR